MKQPLSPKTRSYNILSQGIYTVSDSPLPTIQSKSKNEHRKWVYVAARLVVLIVAITLIVYSFTLAIDGSWSIATFYFFLGLCFFIPFILFGRKIMEMKKVKEVQDQLFRQTE
jgi:hypothetical protein